MSLAFATANEQRGDLVPGHGGLRFISADDVSYGDAELVFAALPHGATRSAVEAARASGSRVVDLSNDYRPKPGLTERSEAAYGLTEVNRHIIAGAELVANPGCYPTAILLALWPLAEAGAIVAGSSIHISAASGVTGAGNAPRRDLLFGEVAENFRAYGTGNTHRHLDEMRAMLCGAGVNADLIFTPHLLPVSRGILATIAVTVTHVEADAIAPWRARFAGERFIEVADSPPGLRDVAHRNVVRIFAQPLVNVRQQTLLVVAAIDNLVKGAAGQAIQNANLMLGFDEALGLPL
jgi:N-acetyl-gamma-glutamyl-phosphate reductase